MKSILKTRLCLFFLICISTQAWGQYSIKGQLFDSRSKYSFILLEYLPSIYGLNQSVMENVVNRVEIDSNGYFSMNGNSLPKEKRLYRLSLVKSKDGLGISTGIWKNHIFLELDHSSQIELLQCNDVSKTFGNCLIKGSPSSQVIQNFYDELKQNFLKDAYKMGQNKTELKEQFLFHKYSTDLKNYCDTSTHLNAAMIAFVHLENRAMEMKNDQDFFDRFDNKISASGIRSPYIIELKNEIASNNKFILGPQKDYSKLIISFLSLCLICLGIYAYSLKKQLSMLERDLTKESGIDLNEKIEALSKKELEVYKLIVAGKSNKEIASALFVETTTIKSHISKVYQKLGVKNRKEAILIWPKNRQ